MAHVDKDGNVMAYLKRRLVDGRQQVTARA
jgi:hypothetical protein